MTTRNAKAILFATLLAALVVPFASMHMTEAQIEEEESAYIRMLKQHESFQNQSPSEQTKHLEAIKESMRNAPPLNAKINEELEILSTIALNIQDSESRGENVTSLYQQFYAKTFDLEQYGVVSEERFLQNPEYWMERAYEAWLNINSDENVPVSFGSDTDSGTIHYVHTDDVSLKNQAQVDYICFTWPVTWYCPKIDVEWGGGSDAHASQYLSHGGTVYMAGKITLHDDGGHDTVYFGFDTEHYVENNGNNAYSETNACPQCYISVEWGSLYYMESFNSLPGYKAHAENHLHETVTVSG